VPNTADRTRNHGVSEATIYNWKAKFGGMDISETHRLTTLVEENANLKKRINRIYRLNWEEGLRCTKRRGRHTDRRCSTSLAENPAQHGQSPNIKDEYGTSERNPERGNHHCFAISNRLVFS
jgi:hypothetical protein